MNRTKRVLLTPGPLTTSESVKQSMCIDIGTRDSDFQDLVHDIRSSLLLLANADTQTYTPILMQGSGTYGVESAITTAVGPNDKLLILENGAYGKRMGEICDKALIPYTLLSFPMTETLKKENIESYISSSEYTHVAYVHCETTAGVLNDIEMIQGLTRQYHKISIVDAMSSFGSIPIHLEELDIDYLITSSNKCLHGVPGTAIIFAKKTVLENCQHHCHSLSLDCYAQYKFFEQAPDAFRFTAPTHVLIALQEALRELIDAGGISARNKRYLDVQKRIRSSMSDKGFKTLISSSEQCPVITTYLYPEKFDFNRFYSYFKQNGFLLYNGKLPNYNAFRIGNIGEITDEDIVLFIDLLENYQMEEGQS